MAVLDPIVALGKILEGLKKTPEDKALLADIDLIFAKIGYSKAALSLLKSYVPDIISPTILLIQMANQYRGMAQFKLAEKFILQALEKEPNHPQAHYVLGYLLLNQSQHEKASYHLQFAVDNGFSQLQTLGMLAECYLTTANWEAFQAVKQVITDKISAHPDSAEFLPPLNYQVIFKSLQGQLNNAKKLGQYLRQNCSQPTFPFHGKSHDKLRIGYISPDFSAHPISLLINTLFSLHDRSQFTIYGFPTRSYQAYDYKMLCETFDHCFELDTYSDLDAAKVIYEQEIDILIDLTGPTSMESYGILVYQPAAVQCQFLGYTGTMGVDFIQYHLSHPMIIPKNYLPSIEETVVYLPETEFATKGFTISNHPLKKSDWGLKEDSFTFYCHHAPYRIEPIVFNAWMKILERAPNSQLWLLAHSDCFKKNIIKHVEAYPINIDRIVFSNCRSFTDYWQHRLADVFLDTFSFTPATSAFFCAWVGVPRITLVGNTPESRQGASYSLASGVSEQITHSIEEYIDKAVDLAQHPEKVKKLQIQLISKRTKSALFNTKRFISHLEQGFKRIWEDYENASKQPFIEISSDS